MPWPPRSSRGRRPTRLRSPIPSRWRSTACAASTSGPQSGELPVCHEAVGNGHIHSAGKGKATQILSAVFDDATNSVTLAGKGTDNGSPVTFIAVAVDGAADVGTFSLTLSDGYTNSGTLLDGSIELH